jgi:hypothetical protein
MVQFESNILKRSISFIKAIISTTKYTNPKNRNYSESWMILFLVFQITLDIFLV